MSIKNILKFLIFMNILFLVLSDDEVVDYKKQELKDMKASVFNIKAEKIYYLGSLVKNKIIGFSDLNNDKLTDIVTYNKSEDNSLYQFFVQNFNKGDKKFDDQKKLFEIKFDEDTKDNISIRNLHIGSFFKSNSCFLVSFNDKNDKLLHYVTCSDDNFSPVKLQIYSNILIMNRNENKKLTLLYYDYNTQKRILCELTATENNYTCNNIDNFEDRLTGEKQYANKPLSLKGGLGYVDLNGNCIPDIVLSHEEGTTRIIEIYVSRKDNKSFKLQNIITLDNAEDFGAFSIMRINDDKSEKYTPFLGLLIPKFSTNQVLYYKNIKSKKYSWSDYLCDDKENDEDSDLFKDDINSAENWTLSIGDQEVSMDKNSYPTIIRTGDFLGTSNPGIIVTHIVGNKTQLSLFERANGKFQFYGAIEHDKISDKLDGDKIDMGLFFDLDETGTLSFIVQTEKGKNYFFFNYKKNIYFVKSKLMNDKSKFYDTDLGTLYRYIVTDKKGDRHMDISHQLVQTSDMNVPLPYSYMGIDDTNNYVEYYQTISGNYLLTNKISRTDNFKGNSPIIPNTQMMISKYYNKDDKIEWNVDLIVQPMEQIWLFLLIVIIVLLIVLGAIIYFHLKEVKEEQKETTKFKSWFA